MRNIPHRLIEELFETSNSTVYWKMRRRIVLDCSHCRPNRGHDNPWSRHSRSDRYKNHRRSVLRRGLFTIRDPRFWEVA